MYSILHVDNSIFFKRILEQVASENQFQLQSVTSPDKALEILEQRDVDLVITGLEFKAMNGLDFIRYLNRSRHKHISKVILTSNDTVEIRKQADALGVLDVLQKDISLNSLYTFIERIKNQRAVKVALQSMDIAVVESKTEAVQEIKKVFENESIHHVTYFNSMEALKKSDQSYAMYLISITADDRNPEKLIIDLRRENMNAIIIALSGVYASESVSNMLLAGADDYVVQPLNRKVFMARINASVRLQMHMGEIETKNMELERINKELNRLVITDGLTGLYNHRYIIERLGLEIEKASRYKRNLAVLMMDIDHFKQVNDTFGHQMGDQVLTKVSDTIMLNLRKIDIVGRYGGEEFLIILPETNINSGLRTAEKIRDLISRLTFDDETLKVTISGGIYQWHGEGVGDLIRYADELLYAAKHSGRNQIISSEVEMMETEYIQ